MGWTHYIDYKNTTRLTQDDLKECLEVIIAFFKTHFPDKVLMSKTDLLDWYGEFCTVMKLPPLENPSHNFLVTKYCDVAQSHGGRHLNDCIFIKQETDHLAFFIGRPLNDWNVVIALKKFGSGFDFFKTNRIDRVDQVYASIYGIVSVMFPGFLSYSSDEIDSRPLLQEVARTVPVFVSAFSDWKEQKVLPWTEFYGVWKAQRVIARAWNTWKAKRTWQTRIVQAWNTWKATKDSVGGKSKKSRANKTTNILSRRSDRLRK